jgi:hypothetical protein
VTARRNRPIEQKESMRWLEGTAIASERLASAAQLIVLGDREFDIYEQFVRIPPGVELIVRAAQNRKLADEDKLLFAAASDWREFGAMQVRVPPHRPGELARIARVGVKIRPKATIRSSGVCSPRCRFAANRTSSPPPTRSCSCIG